MLFYTAAMYQDCGTPHFCKDRIIVHCLLLELPFHIEMLWSIQGIQFTLLMVPDSRGSCEPSACLSGTWAECDPPVVVLLLCMGERVLHCRECEMPRHGGGKRRHYYITAGARDARNIVVAALASAMPAHIIFLILQQPWCMGEPAR